MSAGHFFLAGVVLVARMNRRNGKTFAVRIGVRERAFQTSAAKDDDETMFLAGLDDDLRVADFFDFGGEQRAKFLAGFRRDAAGAAVGDNALFVERAEIGARGHVAVLQFQAQAQRFNHAAAHLKFQRVVAEQPEMPRPAAGRDAGRGGNHAALRGILAQLVEVRRGGGFQRRQIKLLLRGQVAEAVEHDQHELGASGFQCQFGIKRVQIHAPNLRPSPPQRNAIPIVAALYECRYFCKLSKCGGHRPPLQSTLWDH